MKKAASLAFIFLLMIASVSFLVQIEVIRDACADITSELVGHWKFDEGSGATAYDSSGYDNDGVIHGDAIYVDGKIGKALYTDGVDDNVEIADSDSLDVSDALTVAFWFKCDYDVYAGFPEAYLFVGKWHGIGDQARTGFLVNLNEYSDGHMRLWLGFGNWEMNILSSSKVSWDAGRWYHVAATYDRSLPSGNAKLYIDGILDSQLDDNRAVAPNTLSLFINIDPFELWHPWNTYFPGLMDDVRIYNRAIDEEELTELAQAVDCWPMFSHDPAHTGYSTSKAPNANDTLWIFEDATSWITGPSVVNGRVFCGAANGKVYALNESNGALLWNYTTGGPTGIPAVDEGIVFAPSNDNTLYALNESTGALIWSFTLGGDVCSPAVADGMVFASTGRSWEVEGRLYALNKTNGSQIWNYTSSDGLCHPAVANGMVFSADCDGGKVYAFDEFTGAVKWNYTIGTYIDDAPSVAYGIVYIGAWDGLLYALNETTGSFLWNSSAGPWGAAVAIAHGMVICSLEGANEVRALNTTTGAIIWNFTAGDRVSRLAIADGKVFVASKDRKVYALNESTGVPIWTYDTEVIVNEAPCVPSVADGILFVGSETSGIPAKLFAFRGLHDVAISNVSTSKSGCLPKPIVCQGYTARAYVAVVNEGVYPESFNVTAYATNSTDSYEIGRAQVTLSQSESINLTLIWNTSGFAKGNYTISAIADTVPGEAHTENNAFVDDTLEIVLVGDVCPTDGYVGIDDIYNMASHFGQERGQPGYNPNKDINDDDYIGIDDIFTAASHFGEENP